MKVQDLHETWIAGHMLRRRDLIASLAVLSILAPCTRLRAQNNAPDAIEPEEPLIAPVQALYGGFKSYSDKGMIETVYQWPGTSAQTERHRYETAFRAPRNFFFRFDGDAAANGDSFVIWCDGGPFQSWWKSTGVHEVYTGGRGALAFSLGSLPTKDSSNLVAPYFFPTAGLKGPITGLIGVREKGEESIAGHVCRLLAAEGRRTGMGPEERAISVWIDKDSNLIRGARVDAKKGGTAGLVDRIIYAVDPIANPDLRDDRFFFTPPT